MGVKPPADIALSWPGVLLFGITGCPSHEEVGRSRVRRKTMHLRDPPAHLTFP